MEGIRCSFLVLLTLALAASFSPTANAHTIFTTLFINDVSQGDGTCVRMNTDPEHCTSPVPSVTSDDMACGINGEQPVAFTCPAPVGAKLTFQWRLWADAEQPGVIDISHKGPCAVYAKQMTNMSAEDAAAGPGWIKLWAEGYDAGAGKWCTEKLIDSGGLLSVAVPASLPPGSSWLFRPELLALHNAAAGDPQFYVGCAQVYIAGPPSSSSSSSDDDAPATAVPDDPGVLALPAGKSVSIPGYLRASDPGLTFDIYAPSFPYPIPGPEVYIPSSSSFSSSSSSSSPLPPSPPPPLVPPSSSYLIKNANWVGRELDAYATEEGCWAASEACWSRAGACYGAAPPTGSAGCRAWEARCDEVQDACAAGDFRGPPGAGRKLASQEPAPPAPEDIPPAVNAAAAG